MSLLGTVPLFVYQALWSGIGSQAAGRRLVSSLRSRDATERMVAGTLLMRGGRSPVPLLREALLKGSAPPMVMHLAADLDARELAPMIERYRRDADPECAQAATDALEALQARHEPGPAT
jgi:hypothetical protein